jgi:uncharacterized protein YvpB
MAVLCALAALSSCSTSRDRRGFSGDSPCLLAFTNFTDFARSLDSTQRHVTLLSPELKAPCRWDELVVSWNATTPLGTGLKFEARAIYADHATEFYTMGYWAEDTAEQRRESVTGQKDEDGDVLTDTLALKRPTDRLQVRVTFLGEDERMLPALRFLGLSFLNTKAPVTAQPPDKAAWGQSLPVPERSQLSHPGGRDWCSPTSVSMVLAYWAAVRKRPELNMELSEVAAGVYDKNWPGTGNWPFNTAFAGKFDGLRACVTRLADVAELEAFVAAGIPPVCSVSYQLLHGKTSGANNGHLVVCAGFTERGDVVINDPWADFLKGDKVRQVISRQDFAKAWRHSHGTVYLIYPEGWRVPLSPHGRW